MKENRVDANIIATELKDCYIIEPSIFYDNRGYYMTTFNDLKFNIPFGGIVQNAESYNMEAGVLRGMHFQELPYDQAKLVRCTSGAVLDIAYDLRKDSPSFGKYICVELTEENKRELYIPKGFAHGYVALKPNTKFEYSVDADYRRDLENGFNIKDVKEVLTTLKDHGIETPEMSEKDLTRLHVDELDSKFYTHYRYLVTGVKGQLGYEVVKELNSRGIYDVIAVDVDAMDITDSRITTKIITDYKPDVIIHCAAWTAVDKAEEEENKELVNKVNVLGVKNIFNAARLIDAKVIQISTDYVFDGKKENGVPYEVTDIPNPLGEYGRTKVESEKIALAYDKSFVVRTTCVFGINGKNFVRTMRALAENHKQITVVDDQIMSPTYAKDLARVLVDLSETDKYGIYHATNKGFCSWAELASYATRDLDTEIVPVSTEDYYKPQYEKAALEGKELHIAERPRNERLSKESLVNAGIVEPGDWHIAVDKYIEELKEEAKVKTLGGK